MKLPPATLAFPIRELIHVPAAQLLIQLLVSVPGKTEDDEHKYLTPTWDTLRSLRLLALTCFNPSYLANKPVDGISVSILSSLCHSAVQTKMFLKNSSLPWEL